MDKYRAITVQDLIDYINVHKDQFPKGLNTVIMTSDFEGNYLHEKHELYYDYDESKYGPFLAVCYEMHENYDDYESEDGFDDESDNEDENTIITK